MIRIVYHREKCIGCGSCSDLFPDRWIIDEQDGKCMLAGAIPKRNNMFILHATNDELEDWTNAAENCPVNIIEVATY